jgi:hypothetical protein
MAEPVHLLAVSDITFLTISTRFGAEMLAKIKHPQLPGGLAFKINGVLACALKKWVIIVLMKLAGLI